MGGLGRGSCTNPALTLTLTLTLALAPPSATFTEPLPRARPGAGCRRCGVPEGRGAHLLGPHSGHFKEERSVWQRGQRWLARSRPCRAPFCAFRATRRGIQSSRQSREVRVSTAPVSPMRTQRHRRARGQCPLAGKSWGLGPGWRAWPCAAPFPLLPHRGPMGGRPSGGRGAAESDLGREAPA